MRQRFSLFLLWLLLGTPLVLAARLALGVVAPVLGGANTTFATGASETVKTWATTITVEAAREILFAKWMGEDENNFIRVNRSLTKQAGDRITFTLGRKLTGTGVGAGATLAGQEEVPNVYSFNVTLDQRRNAVRLGGELSEARTAFDQRILAKDLLKKWLAEYIDDDFFTTLDASPSVVIFGGAATSTATITANDKFTANLIDKAVGKARKASPKIWPVVAMGKAWYLTLIHTDVAYDLKQDPAWQQAQRDANTMGEKNPIFSGADFVWGGAIIHSHEKVPITTNYGSGANLTGASNMFLGREAGCIAWGRMPKGWEEVFDYGDQNGFAISAIWEVAKSIYNSADYAYESIRCYRTSL